MLVMQPQARLGDNSFVPEDTHGKSCCPHACQGPAQTGSPDVFVNNQNALRVTDTGIHAKCCGPNTWVAVKGSPSVLINNLQAHRLFDLDEHCGGPGYMIQASPDVFVGDGTEIGLSQAKQTGKALVEICSGN
ncbi:MAG TPA: PAAR domain-containing protein [Bryobacteraceae bacterium]|nr:PAAR domain-containing protein [Bryobacteraceae bacterium]